MAESVIVDTGPLVALLDKADQDHESCVRTASQLEPPFVTTWLVVTEAAWLLRRAPGGMTRLLELLQSEELVRCENLDSAFVSWLQRFMRRYADLRPQIADASVVYLAEHYQTQRIFTLDRRDFHVFRTAAGKSFSLIPE